MRGPLLVPGGAVILGAELALRSPGGSPLLAVGLLAAGLALGARAGLAVCALGLGLLCVWARPGTGLGRLDGERPVAVEAHRLTPWARDAHGWNALVRLRRIARAGQVEVVRTKLRLSLGGADRPPAGRRFRAQGYLGSTPVLGNGGAARSGTPRLRVKSRRLIRFSGPVDPGRERLHATGLELAGRSDGAALARALVLGDANSLRPRLVRALRRAGLGHLLALSGLHVGILAGVGLWLGRLWLGRLSSGPWQWLPAAAGSVLLLAVVGPRPAILRASLMALFTWAALARGSRPLSWNALAVALAAMVASEPELLRELGFLLTAAATAGILWQAGTAPAGAAPWRRAVRVSLAAQIFTLPWALPAFGLLAPVAWVHNLWAVPWTAVALIVSLCWLCLAAASAAAARSSLVLVEAVAAPFGWLSRLAGGPWWSLPVAVGRLEAVVLALLGALALRRPRLAALPLAALAAVAVGGEIGRGPGGPELALLDVGQGEAILIRDRGRAVLVDGGGWARGDIGGRVLVPALARLGVRRLQAIVLTHPDLDHCGGLAGLADYLPVAELWTPAGWPPEGCALDLLSLPGVAWRPLWTGWQGGVGEWRLRALSPRPGERGTGNDRSLVLRAEARGFTALLTGDIEARAEHALVAGTAPELLRADLLKVPHHGSRTSTGGALLEAVGPRLAWISAGAGNRYGHPHPRVLERLAARGVRVLRTDRDGLVHLRVGPAGPLHLSLPGAPK